MWEGWERGQLKNERCVLCMCQLPKSNVVMYCKTVRKVKIKLLKFHLFSVDFCNPRILVLTHLHHCLTLFFFIFATVFQVNVPYKPNAVCS